jgi:hypothetical protein
MIFKAKKKFKKVITLQKSNKALKNENRHLRSENERLNGKLKVKSQQIDRVCDILIKTNEG